MKWIKISVHRVHPRFLRSLVHVVGWRSDGAAFFTNQEIECDTEKDWKFAEKCARSELHKYLYAPKETE